MTLSKKFMTAVFVMASATTAMASEKDFFPGCLTGADNSRQTLVVLDNYLAVNNDSAGIERLRESVKNGQSIYISYDLLTSLSVSDADAR